MHRLEQVAHQLVGVVEDLDMNLHFIPLEEREALG
jgi:hypothetical protein